MTFNNDINAEYRVGTFTPGLAFGGASVGMTFTEQVGNYIKIGRLVVVWATITLSAKGSSTGTAALTGLPFTVSSVTFNGNCTVDQSGITTSANYTYVTGRATASNTTVGIFQDTFNGATSTQLQHGAFSDTTSINITLEYLTA